MLCRQKQKYTKSGAQKMRKKLYRRHSTRLRVYECPECNHYHLTSMTYLKEPRVEDKRPHREKVTLWELLEEDF